MDFDLPSRRALAAAFSLDDQAMWHVCDCLQPGLKLRARLMLGNTERQLPAAGAEVTIHTLWVPLADRAQ